MARRIGGIAALCAVAIVGGLAYWAVAQPPGGPEFGPPPGGGPRERGRPGFGGPGGPEQPERKLVDKHDKNGDGWLNVAERAEARKDKPENQPRGGFGRRGPGGRANREPAKPGPHISPAEVQNYRDAKLYDPTVLRTFFLKFENDDWEQELADFYNTDVDVPATLTIDGKKYPNVGVRFRGQSSYFMTPAGYKRSVNLSFDFLDSDQRLYGYRTVNLLNLSGDDSMMSTVLYSRIARQYLPTPQANFVRVVINGEYWGIYTNVEQFNKDFLQTYFGTPDGARWKVDGNPRGDGGLRYLGEEFEPYRERFDIKSEDKKESWRDLVKLCRTLHDTPPENLEAALEPMLDIDSVLWFLAIDVSLVNSDGYWTRASDYTLYEDPNSRFHLLPHDMNEAFRGREHRFGPPGGGPPPDGPPDGPPGGPPDGAPPGPPPGGFGRFFGGPGGMREGSVTLDPTIVLDDERMPLRAKLLADPELRARYLRCVRTIAENSLDWETFGPVVADLRTLIHDDVEKQTRSLTSFDGFLRATDDQPAAEEDDEGPMSLRDFADRRREYLLEQTESAEGVTAPPVWKEAL